MVSAQPRLHDLDHEPGDAIFVDQAPPRSSSLLKPRQPSQAAKATLWVEFKVQDTGVGIDDSDRPLLFQAYAISRRGSQQETGCGLGLNICKELVSATTHCVCMCARVRHSSVYVLACGAFLL